MPTSSKVGFDAGWRLEFRPDTPAAAMADPVVTVDRSGYDADVQVGFESTWSSPTFTVTVDGMRQADVDAILSRNCSIVTVALGWRDTPGSFLAAGANLLAAAGLGGSKTSALPTVLTGRITALERTAGDVRYRTRFSGIDAVWSRLQTAQLGDATLPPPTTAGALITALCGRLTPPVPVAVEGDDRKLEGVVDPRPTDRVADALQALARVAFPEAPGGRVPLLLRDGTVHVGAWTTSVTGGSRHRLDASGGLVDATPAPYEHDDPAKSDPFATSTADAWDVSLLGRPDIKVGDIAEIGLPKTVTKSPPGGAAAVLGALGALGALAAPVVGLLTGAATISPRDFRVLSVSHVLGRTTGFSTTLRVEGVDGGPRQPGPAHEANRVAESIDARIGAVGQARRPIDVGIVTGQSVIEAETPGVAPAQRLGLDSGLAEAPPPNLVVRGELDSPRTHLVDKPYLTPFAFGGTGLVIPHYPGTRVVQLNHAGDQRNAVVAGCVWPEDTEPVSQLGDWWLTLPTQVSPADSGKNVTPAPSGPVASDLINADGGRVINVKGFEITVGQSLMPTVGGRPDDAAPGTLTIRSAGGNASISIDTHGNVSISTDKEIRFSGQKVVMSVSDGVEIEKRST